MSIIQESDVREIPAEVEAISWRPRGCIRVRELAATHRLRQMRRLRMLKEHKPWKREAGFDNIDTVAEMDARRSRTNLVSEPFFYSKMFNPRWPHTHDKFTLEVRVDVEGLRMEFVLSQLEPPPQCDAPPRRLPTVDMWSEEPGTPGRLPAVDTWSEEPGTPRRLPAIGTGSDETGLLRGESTEREGIVPLQASVGGFLRFNCTSPEQDCILFQPDVGINDEKYQLTTVPHNKPLLARSSRDQRRSANRKGWQHGLPSKASNLTPEVIS